MHFSILPVLVLTLSLSLLSPSSSADIPTITESGCRNLPTLVCNVSPTDGWSTSGAVYFTPVWVPRGVGDNPELFTCYTKISAAVSGLTNPKHGFHVHTYGDLSFPDGTSTGGHFTNPAGDEIDHGLPNDAVRHWGDFGNLDNDGSGLGTYERVDMVIRLGGVVGRAITIHEDEDQGSGEQPTGAAGARIGYCVIGYSNPEVLSSAGQ